MSIIQMLLGGSSAQNLIIPSGVNLNIFQLAGSPSYPANLNVIIPPSSTVGSNNPAVASLTVGSFVAGSNIVIHNYGKILGAGGLINGGVGGTALNANVPSTVTVAVYNYTGGQMKGGGGGGGNGGTGGAGGTGGNGVSTTLGPEQYNLYGPSGTAQYWYADRLSVYTDMIIRDQPAGYQQVYYGGQNLTAVAGYTRGTLQLTVENWGQDYQSFIGYGDYYSFRKTTNVTTIGGTGGAGGIGGAGGRGQGYDVNAQTGSIGAYGGTGGPPSGANAGYGGAGGKGGNAGNGGDWGQAGTNGGTGNTGSPGTSGNSTAGSPGSAGAAGTAGGLGGYYLFKSSTVVFNNAGGIVAGRIN